MPQAQRGSFLLLVAACARAAQEAAAQHVLFVLIDDLGYSDVSYHGDTVSNATVLTPSIDALAAVRLENYYVTQLCSPTRTSLMSGRYAYNIGMNGEVIVDGHPSCMPLEASTIADRMQAAGWQTAAYGKWDLGMTSWGCTPTCRGFDHFFGFYNAFNDYFTHHVGTGLDLRNDTTPAKGLNGSYFTELVTAEHIRWIKNVMTTNKTAKTFTYLAHEANHAPLEVPIEYIRGGCLKIPESNPSRRILCGMMTAVDDSMRNVTEAYKQLGIWDKTIVIFSTDNGGNTDTGGSNWPLRGQKATTWEGGVRGVGWVGGGFVESSLITSGHTATHVVSTAMIHVTDWYPTIVHGIAGLAVNVPALDGSPALDGVNAWPSIASGANSSDRTEMLLQLNPDTAKGAGESAIRQGRWKLMTGITCAWGMATLNYSCAACGRRDQKAEHNPAWEQPLPVTAETSPPFCPNGWTPPPESMLAPVPPADAELASAGVSCHGAVPCYFPNASFCTGGTFLFDIEADPYEQHEVSAQHPDVVRQLVARLQEFADKNITQQNYPIDAASDPKHFGGVWTPWQGSPDPEACAHPLPPPAPQPMSQVDGLILQPQPNPTTCGISGWCSGPGYSGPPLPVRILLDGEQVANATASAHRKIAGDHGFSIPLDCAKLTSGKHKVQADAMFEGRWCKLGHSPVCTSNGKVVPC